MILAIFLVLVLLADAFSAGLRRGADRSSLQCLSSRRGGRLTAGAMVLAAVAASFAYLGLDLRGLLAAEALRSMANFVGGVPGAGPLRPLRRQTTPRAGAPDAGRVGRGHRARRAGGGGASPCRPRGAGGGRPAMAARFVLNLLRSVPEAGVGRADGAGRGPGAVRRGAGPGAAHPRRAAGGSSPRRCRTPAVRPEPRCAARGAPPGRAGLRHTASGGAAVAGLHAVPLGDEHPHGRGARVRRRGGARARCSYSPLALPAGAGRPRC